MRIRTIIAIGAAAGAIAPDTAAADFPHVVVPGESLTSVAAVDGLSVDQLAAANGLPTDAQLIIGTTLLIPPQSVTGTGQPTSSVAGTTVAGSGVPSGDDGTGTTESVSTTAAPSSYVVQPGDSLTAIAARAGTSVDQLAAANGLDPIAPLLIGTVLSLTGGGGSGSGSGGGGQTANSQPVGAAAQGSPSSPPYPTDQSVSADQIGSIASANGVPPALAQAIAWQESGFNNGLVSSADARGVMQITPGTWNWIGQNLAGSTPLAPASATDNIRGGVLLLRSLLDATGGDPAQAAAGYVQGLPSVRQNGMYAETQQYVNDVLALEQHFGGG